MHCRQAEYSLVQESNYRLIPDVSDEFRFPDFNGVVESRNDFGYETISVGRGNLARARSSMSATSMLQHQRADVHRIRPIQN